MSKKKEIPTWTELAQLVVNLAEMNVSNIDAPENSFISCFTFEGDFADHWLQAARIRRLLLDEKMVAKGQRYTCISKEKWRKELSKAAR